MGDSYVTWAFVSRYRARRWGYRSEAPPPLLPGAKCRRLTSSFSRPK
jgi:hypothetical protein